MLWSLTQEVAGSSPFTVVTNTFEFSENSRKDSIAVVEFAEFREFIDSFSLSRKVDCVTIHPLTQCSEKLANLESMISVHCTSFLEHVFRVNILANEVS